MMSAYTYNRLFALPFIFFLLFGLFFVMNIVLASVYSNYKRGLETRATSFTQSREKSLDIAFDLLTKDNRMLGSSKRGGVEGIPVQVFRDLVHELSEYGTNVPAFDSLSASGAGPDPAAGDHSTLAAAEWSTFIEAAIDNVDQDQNGFVSKEEFRELCVLLPRGFAHAQHEASTAAERRSESSTQNDEFPFTMMNCAIQNNDGFWSAGQPVRSRARSVAARDSPSRGSSAGCAT